MAIQTGKFWLGAPEDIFTETEAGLVEGEEDMSRNRHFL